MNRCIEKNRAPSLPLAGVFPKILKIKSKIQKYWLTYFSEYKIYESVI